MISLDKRIEKVPTMAALMNITNGPNINHHNEYKAAIVKDMKNRNANTLMISIYQI
jgi:hypothetical protein